jgi:hypothetical protein
MKKIQMTPKVRAALLAQREAFKKKFGREPGEGDPVFSIRILTYLSRIPKTTYTLKRLRSCKKQVRRLCLFTPSRKPGAC